MEDLSKNNHLSEDQIAEIADAINSDDLDSISQQYIDHVKECEQCADEIMLVSEVSEMPDAGKITTKTATNRSIKIFMAFAASVALILTSYYVFIKPESNNSNIAQNNDTIENSVIVEEAITDTDTLNIQKVEIKEQSEDKLIEQEKINLELEKNQNQYAFEENKELENLFQRFNSASMRSGELNMISDSVLEISSKDSVLIEWEETKLSYSIQILDNQGEELISKDDLKSNFKSTTNFNSGLYYWKLLDEDYNLVYCGKILVEK